jgi:hypothetical protein
MVSKRNNYIERKRNGLSNKILKVYSWSEIHKSKVVKKNDVLVIGYIPFLHKYGIEATV